MPDSRAGEMSPKQCTVLLLYEIPPLPALNIQYTVVYGCREKAQGWVSLQFLRQARARSFSGCM